MRVWGGCDNVRIKTRVGEVVYIDSNNFTVPLPTCTCMCPTCACMCPTSTYMCP